MTNDGPSINYQLTIIQQPELSQVISSSQRNRRYIEPCPVVQVQMTGPDGTKVDISDLDDEYVMRVQLYKENGEQHIDAVDVPVVAGSSQQSANISNITRMDPLFGNSSMAHNRVDTLVDEKATQMSSTNSVESPQLLNDSIALNIRDWPTVSG
ncbi:hypothetical protein GGH93_001203 [Coemansia aciculifera]|nr:hypothetical protein GGH93_001203 [Coemansia aciculifera]